MKTLKSLLVATGVSLVAFSPIFAQETSQNKVIITGVRFAYPLVDKWIKQYSAENPKVQVVIETRTITDPEKYDLLIEA